VRYGVETVPHVVVDDAVEAVDVRTPREFLYGLRSVG
jgi:hypothetical protein